MHRAFLNRLRGYNIKEIVAEATGEWALRRIRAAGFHLRCDYAAHYRDKLPCPETRPFLVGVTREDAIEGEGSLVSHVFVHTPPRLGLRAQEKEMLRRALNGDTDEVIADALSAALPTVKSWWQRVYQRVEAVAPAALPGREDEGTAGARGKEKRRLLLNYLRDHPEELRLP
ncbi:MAG: hypothetical protein JO250_19450 [Armatimonadetes bacterium]|nr:hypothetical protein [Armatimonadota bacterium]